MLENNELNVKKKVNLKGIIIWSSIATILVVMVIVGSVIGCNVNSYSNQASENVVLRFVEKWNLEDTVNPLTSGIKLSDEVGEHSYQITDAIIISYEIDNYLWIRYGEGNVELDLGDMPFDSIKALAVEYINLFDHIKDFSSRYDNAVADGSIGEEKKPCRISVNELQAVIYCKDGSKCRFSKDGPTITPEATNRFLSDHTLDSFIVDYNDIVINSSSTAVSATTASNSKYINAAKTLIEENLRFPDTVIYEVATVSEKDNYGRAIVYLDYSAENAIGMALRSTCYVFINGCDVIRNTFEYNRVNYRCDNVEMLEFYKEGNNFGVNPAEVLLAKYLIDEENLDDTGKVLITNETTYDKLQSVLNCGTLNFYLDGQDVVAIVFVADHNGNSEDIKLITDAIYSVQVGKTKLVTASEASVFFDVEKIKNSHEEALYLQNGILLQRQKIDTGVAYAIMSLDKSQYALGDAQWKPLCNDRYYEAIGDSYFANGEFETALRFYQEGNVGSENYISSVFKVAESLENRNEYEKAITLYELVLDYSETEERYKKCNYFQGEIYLSEGKLDDAINAFTAAGDYLDAAEKLDDAVFARAVAEDGMYAMYEDYYEVQWERTEDTMFSEVWFRSDGYVELKMKAYTKSVTPGGGYEEGYVDIVGEYTKKNFKKIILGDLYFGVVDGSGMIVPSSEKYFNAGIVATTTRTGTELYDSYITSVSFSGMEECVCDTEPYGYSFDDETEVFFLVYDDGETPQKLPDLKQAISISGEFYATDNIYTRLNFSPDGSVKLTLRAREEAGWHSAYVCFMGEYELVDDTEIKFGDLYFDSYSSLDGAELAENKDLCLYKSGMSFTIEYLGIDSVGKPIWTGTLHGVEHCINLEAELMDINERSYSFEEFGTSFQALKNPVVQ